MPFPALSVDVRREDDDVVVAVAGEIDVATGPTMWSRIQQAMADRPVRLIIDLSDTTFMDSTGLAIVIRASGIYGSDAVRVRAQGRVLALFELTGLHHHIQMVTEVEEPAPSHEPRAPGA